MEEDFRMIIMQPEESLENAYSRLEWKNVFIINFSPVLYVFSLPVRDSYII